MEPKSAIHVMRGDRRLKRYEHHDEFDSNQNKPTMRRFPLLRPDYRPRGTCGKTTRYCRDAQPKPARKAALPSSANARRGTKTAKSSICSSGRAALPSTNYECDGVAAPFGSRFFERTRQKRRFRSSLHKCDGERALPLIEITTPPLRRRAFGLGGLLFFRANDNVGPPVSRLNLTTITR